MSHKKNIKEALAESFKALLLEYPFEKITIKMITDQIGVIRPTFYNHFIDKYEVLEWICYKDIFEGLELLVENGMYSEAIKLLFTKIEHNKVFYLKAVKVKGQNAFMEIFQKHIKSLIELAFKQSGTKIYIENKVFTPEAIAGYYTQGLTYIIEEWLDRELPVNAEEITKAYYVLASTSMEHIIEKGIETYKK